ncbi:MAG: hypothetical protein DMG23_14470 [Acidobacteria bacterium]|nr:MAG: hypothetical protein DMG23_14470 [Acidobacteriota bacterium]
MLKTFVAGVIFVLGLAASCPLSAADPAAWNPAKALVRTAFDADLELYSGGIAGQNLGAAYRSINRGNYGARLNFGFFKVLSFSVGYLYSNQVRTLTTTLPQGTAELRSLNLNSFYGNADFNLIRLPRATFYLSPGVGLTRYAARSFDWITSTSTTSYPIAGTSAPTANLGMGVKITAWRRWGLSFDARDFLSTGGELPQAAGTGGTCPGPSANCIAGFFKVPPQNSLVVSLGLVIKLL